MPLPIIIAGLAGVAAAVGIGAQMDAKETNQRAQQIASDAQNMYDNAKQSLEKSQLETEKSLVALGTSKKNVLETSIQQFLHAYERIKNVELSESIGLDEIKHFSIEKQDALQLQEMSDIYESTFSSGVAGAATGAVIALAASGSLPVVTGLLSTAGSALAIGEVGLAAGIAGSALSFGAAMTPLSAIAAPVLLFSGISSSIKADENLEKANAMYAEAQAASEQMKTSEVLCCAIADRADMFDSLLGNLNQMFSQCTALLDGVTRRKMGSFKNKEVDARTFTEDELKLVAVTRALAGAVKAVIDTPILTADGVVSEESQNVYEDTWNKLPAFVEAVNEVKSAKYSVRPVIAASTQGRVTSIPNSTRNIAAIVVGFFASIIAQAIIARNLSLGLMVFGSTALIIMDNDSQVKLFKYEKNFSCIALSAGFCLLLYQKCQSFAFMSHYIIGSIVIGFASLLIVGAALPSRGEKVSNLRRTLARFFGCVFFFAIAILAYAFLCKFLGFSHTLSLVITSIVYAFFSLIAAFIADS